MARKQLTPLDLATNKIINLGDPTSAQDAATKNYVDTGKQGKISIVVGSNGDSGYITDGTADDVQIQAAIDAVNTAGGGTVRVQAGTYRIAALMTLRSGVAVVGAGIGKTTLRYATGTVAATNMFQLASGTTRQYNNAIQHMTLDAQDQVDKGLVNLNGVITNLDISYCELINMNCTTSAKWALRIGAVIDADIDGSASFNVQIHDNIFKNNDCYTFEVILLPNVRDSQAYNNLFEGNNNDLTDEVSIYGFNVNFKYHHNIHKNWSDYAVGAKESDQVEITDNTFTNTSTTAGGAVRFFNQIHGKVNNNVMVFASGSTSGGIALRDYNVGRDGHVQRNVNSFSLDISGNRMTNVYYGIHNFTSSSSNFAYHDINIERNEFYACAKSPVRFGPNASGLTMSVYNIFVRYNTVYSWSGNVEGAISFYGDTSDATKMYGIIIENNYIANNTTGASSGAIRISAATVSAIKNNYLTSSGSYGAVSTPNSGVVTLIRDNVGVADFPLPQGKMAVVVGATDADYITDGTADNVEIQAAIDAVSTAGGGVIRLRKGTYNLTTAIKVKSNIVLEGEGFSTVLTQPNTTNIDIIDNHDVNNGNINIVLRDFKIVGNGVNQSSAVNGIYLDETSDCLIQNVYITGTRGYGIYMAGESTSVRNSTDNRIINCILEGAVDSTRDGLHAIYTTRLIVEGCVARSNARHGLHVNRSDGAIVANCQAYSNTGTGIVLFITNYCHVSNSVCRSNTAQGLSLGSGCNYNLISNCTIDSNGSYGLLGGGASTQNEYNQFIGNKITANGDDGLVIFYSNYAVATGNTIKNNLDQGIAVDNSKHCVVSGNYSEGNRNEGIEVKNSSTDCVISNNVVKNNSNVAQGGTAGAQSGIQIETGITGCVVNGNRCFDDQGTKTQDYGIEMQGTADYCTLVGNNLTGNLTGGMLVVGANNEIGLNIGY